MIVIDVILTRSGGKMDYFNCIKGNPLPGSPDSLPSVKCQAANVPLICAWGSVGTE